MRTRAAALLAAVVLAAAACSSRSAGSPTPPPGGVVVHLGEAAVAAEVADTQAERARGLMGRRTLGPAAGMLFVFGSETTGSFWMKNTLIPLSIAFMRRDDRSRWEVVAILDMELCRSGNCPDYFPETSYQLALEVNQGFFERTGVKKGSRVTFDEGRT